MNNNYGVTQFYYGAVFPDGKSYFGGTQDNGTLIGTDAAGANQWRELFGGDGGYVAVDAARPSHLYVETTRLSLRKSTDGGVTFGSARFGIEEPAGNLYFADQLNHTVRRISPDGQINKIAGTDQSGTSLDAYEAEVTYLNSPAGVAIDDAGNLFIADTGNHRVLVVAAYRGFANVSAASYLGSVVASEMIAAAFGTGLATKTEAAAALPLPTALGGTAVKVRDSAGQEKAASLFFVSPGQVNYQIPPALAEGAATVSITSGDGTISTSAIFVSPSAPGLFAANANGQGVAAAVLLRVKASGEQGYEPVAYFDSAQNRFVAKPIDLGPPGDQVYVLLFGTGLRGRSSLAAVNVTIGGISAEVFFAGAQGGFAGLDQVNVLLPRSLASRGGVDVALTLDGKKANLVWVDIK